MRVDDELVRHLARLAGLSDRDSDLPVLEAEMRRLVEWVDQLPDADEPAESLPSGSAMRLRDDQPRPGLDRAALTGLVPRLEEGLVVVPCAVPQVDLEPE